MLLVASRQVVNLTLTVISLILGASVLIDMRPPIIFLILPFFLYGLMWTQLRYILLVRRAAAYISDVIAPRVRSILQEIYPDEIVETKHILDWEERWQSPGHRKSGILLLPVLGANYGIPLFTSIVLLFLYISSSSGLSFFSLFLIAINIIAIIYSIFLGFLFEFRRFGQDFIPKTKDNQDTHEKYPAG